MRFSVVISGLFAVMAAAESTVSAPPTSVALSPAQQSQMNCFKACAEGDVNCQARCVGVPSPDGSQANATTQCVANCPQGKGTAADIKAFGDCTDKCINKYYFVTSKGTPEATGAAGGNNAASNTDTAAAPTGTDSSASGSETGAAATGSATKSGNGSSTKTGTASTTSATHNAAPAIIASGGALVGVIAALLAL